MMIESEQNSQYMLLAQSQHGEWMFETNENPKRRKNVKHQLTI